MGANSSCISELPSNEYLIRLCSTECISSNDPFWNQLLSFTFQVPRNRFDLVMSYLSCLPILKTSLGLCCWLSCVCLIWATVSYSTPVLYLWLHLRLLALTKDYWRNRPQICARIWPSIIVRLAILELLCKCFCRELWSSRTQHNAKSINSL